MNKQINITDQSLTSIRKMKLEDLIQLGSQLGLTYTNEKKTVWAEVVLQKFAEQAGTKMIGDLTLTETMTAIINNKEMSKSERMRELHALGVPTAQISRELAAHYSFVHTIISKMEAKAKAIEILNEAKAAITAAAEPVAKKKALVQPTQKKVETKVAKPKKVGATA